MASKAAGPSDLASVPVGAIPALTCGCKALRADANSNTLLRCHGLPERAPSGAHEPGLAACSGARACLSAATKLLHELALLQCRVCMSRMPLPRTSSFSRPCIESRNPSARWSSTPRSWASGVAICPTWVTAEGLEGGGLVQARAACRSSRQLGVELAAPPLMVLPSTPPGLWLQAAGKAGL